MVLCRGAASNTDDDSDEDEETRKQQEKDKDKDQDKADPLETILSDHARKYGAYLGGGRHLPVHSEEFNELRRIALDGYRRWRPNQSNPKQPKPNQTKSNQAKPELKPTVQTYKA